MERAAAISAVRFLRYGFYTVKNGTTYARKCLIIVYERKKRTKGVELMAKSTMAEWTEPDKLLLLEAWARDGLTDEQIAGNMGINVRTLYLWKKKNVQIFQSLKVGKEVADIEVENALRKKALGFRETEQTVSTRRTVEYENGKRIREVTEPVVTEVEKYYPPDTTAQIFWLKNRKPEKWRDKQEQKVDLTEAVKIIDSIGDGD